MRKMSTLANDSDIEGTVLSQKCVECTAEALGLALFMQLGRPRHIALIRCHPSRLWLPSGLFAGRRGKEKARQGFQTRA